MSLCQQEAAKYWPADQQPVARAVCLAESGGDPNAHCLNCAGVPEDSRGLFQINVDAHAQWADLDLFDPDTNAQIAFALWQSDGWAPWSTYSNGTYRKYLTRPRTPPTPDTTTKPPAAAPSRQPGPGPSSRLKPTLGVAGVVGIVLMIGAVAELL